MCAGGGGIKTHVRQLNHRTLNNNFLDQCQIMSRSRHYHLYKYPNIYALYSDYLKQQWSEWLISFEMSLKFSIAVESLWSGLVWLKGKKSGLQCFPG